MDEVAAYNRARWQALAEACAGFTRPALDLDIASARAMLDPEGRLGPLAGTRVLCLASGGGQQSAAFAVLGARVTVVDLSDAQLQRDHQVAARYGVPIDTVQADMRDLSMLDAGAFQLVWQPYSINFVPDARAVFGQVARVLERHGTYHLQCANPFVLGVGTRSWRGDGYLLTQAYLDGAVVETGDEPWVYRSSPAAHGPIPGPREYRHSLSTILNGLIDQGFVIRHVADGWGFSPDLSAPGGTWDHLVSVAPPWLALWASYQPG